MPYLDPYSQVAQGRDGTGAAYILSGNKALDVFMHNNEALKQQKRMEAYQRLRQQQEQDQLINQKLSQVKLAEHWQPHDKELQTDFQNALNQAKQLKAQGIDPTNDPTWKSNFDSLNTKAAYSNKLATGLNKLLEDINNNPDKYSEESIARAKSYFDPNKPLSKYIEDGQLPPALEAKHTYEGLLKGLKGTPREYEAGGKIIKESDRAANVKQVLGRMDSPEFKTFIKEEGGDPNFPAFPLNINGKTIFSTRDENLAPLAEKYLSKIDPTQYRSMGLKSSTPEDAKLEMVEVMKRQNKAYGSVVSKGADILDSGVESQNKTNWAADSSRRGWAHLDLSERRANKEDSDATFRQDWINDMFDGVEGSGEKLKAAAKGNPQYQGELDIKYDPKNTSKLHLKIPDRVIESIDTYGNPVKKTISGRTVTIDKNNPDDKITMNQIVNEMTGEKVNVSQLMTQGGKKKVAGGKGADNIQKSGKDNIIPKTYTPGMIMRGYKFKGGDPAKAENWIKI